MSVLIIATVRGHNRDIFFFLFFIHIKICCVFSLELPHRGNSNEYTNIPLAILKRKSPEIIPNTIRSAAMEFFGKELKNEFEIAAVNEPSVFEPLKVLLYFFP